MIQMKNKIFFIAEISANHCGDFNLAKKLIKCAYQNGADAVKLQTYTADTMTIKSDKRYFKIKDGLWKGYNLWDLYNEAHTPLKWHKELFKYGKSLGIKIFSTPFASEFDISSEISNDSATFDWDAKLYISSGRVFLIILLTDFLSFMSIE